MKASFRGLLEYNRDRNPKAGISAIVQVVPIVIVDINVVGGIPVLRPALRPRVDKHERITTVLEARIASNNDGTAMDTKPVPAPKIENETIRGNIVAAIAATLVPGAMVDLPILGAVLLPRTVPLPTATLL